MPRFYETNWVMIIKKKKKVKCLGKVTKLSQLYLNLSQGLFFFLPQHPIISLFSTQRYFQLLKWRVTLIALPTNTFVPILSLRLETSLWLPLSSD